MLQRLLPDYSVSITQEEDQTICWFEEGYLLFNNKKSQYCYVREAPPIKNIVFSGGGTRGILYAGVIKAFEEYIPSPCHGNENFISQIDTLSAASIGSVFNAPLAAGIRADELLASLGKLDFTKLLGEGLGPIKRDGAPLYELLKKIIPDIISKRLEERKEDLTRFIQETDKEHREVLEKLTHELSSEAPVITFSMLNALHYFCPKIFKDLTIAVVCKETGQSNYFNADNTPEVEIALACRASFAVPIFLKAVPVPKKQVKCYAHDTTLPQELHFVDGGLLDNIPFSILENGQKNLPGLKGDYNQNLQTLIVFFDDSIAAPLYDIEKEVKEIAQRQINKFPYIQSPFLNVRSFSEHELAPKTSLDFIYNMAPKIIDGININDMTYTSQREHIYEQVRHKYSQRNIPLPAWFASSDFEKANKYGPLVIEKSKKLTKAYLKNHAGECVYQSYHHINELIKDLPDDLYELMKCHADHIPSLAALGRQKIETIRLKKNDLNHWFENYDEVLQICKPLSSSKFFPIILKNFSIIKNDIQATADKKIIRSLSVTLDYYPRLKQVKEHKVILAICKEKLDTYFKYINDKTIENIKSAFLYKHFFYVKFQRIMLVLSYVTSSFINPEDAHRRKFLETITNDLCDIAAYHLSEEEKLSKMENYIVECYYKVIYYQNKSTGHLAKALQHIIQSHALLNLTYKYGFILRERVSKLTDFNDLLRIFYSKKKIFFIREFLSLTNCIHDYGRELPTFCLLKEKFFPFIYQAKLTLLDEIKMQAIVVALLSSHRTKERKLAHHLLSLMIPADLVRNSKRYSTIFAAMSLLASRPLQGEEAIYDKLALDLYCLIQDYKAEKINRPQLAAILVKYYPLLKQQVDNIGFCLFKQSSSLLHRMQLLMHKFKCEPILNEIEQINANKPLTIGR